MHILIVDDEKDFPILIEHFFKKRVLEDQWQLFFAHNAQEARETMEKTHITHVVTDIFMPGEDGVTLGNFIIDTYPNIKVILMSAYPPSTFQENTDFSRFSAFLSKPLSLSTLEKILHNFSDQ